MQRLNPRTQEQLDGGWDREAQIGKNQKAMDCLKAMIARNRSRKTTQADLEFWRLVYQTIDEQRPQGQKLFLEKQL